MSLNCRVVKLWESKGKRRCQQPVLQIENGTKSQQEIFPESIIGSQFFYVDQFVISASGNKVSVHRIDLGNNIGDARLAKTFRISVGSTPNRNTFHSFHSYGVKEEFDYTTDRL